MIYSINKRGSILAFQQTKLPSKMSGVVYIIKLTDSNSIKIGCTANFEQRQTSLVREYGGFNVIHVSEPHSTYKATEKKMHSAFAQYRIGSTEFFSVESSEAARAFNSEAVQVLNRIVSSSAIIISDNEYLSLSEIALLLEASKKTPRYGARNYAICLISYRYALGINDIASLTWDNLDFKKGTFTIDGKVYKLYRHVKNALNEFNQTKQGYLFKSERNKPLSYRMIQKVAEGLSDNCNIGFTVYHKMFRASRAYHLVERGENFKTVKDFLRIKQDKYVARFFAYNEAKPLIEVD